MGNMRKIQFVWPKSFATFFFVWGKKKEEGKTGEKMGRRGDL